MQDARPVCMVPSALCISHRAVCIVHFALCIPRRSRRLRERVAIVSARDFATCLAAGRARAAKPVQDQLRERYASLTRKIEQAGTPAGDLANEYGETGKILMAAEYRDAAEPCFLNAQALVPGDVRWPYYLAHLYRLRNEPEKSAVFFEKALELLGTALFLNAMRAPR